MNFEENIKKWVTIDNQIKSLAVKSKELKDEKNNMEQDILNYVDTKELKNATISISDGKLRFVSSKQTAPLTLKYIEECLTKCIHNTKQVDQIMTIIKDSREIKYSEDIKRYYSK